MQATDSWPAKVRRWCAIVSIGVFAWTALVFGQTKPDMLPLPQTPQQPDSEAPAFTFTAVTRMVIVEVVARDREDNPVRNLTAADLQISETIDGSKEIPEKIASIRPVNDAVAAPSENKKGIVLSWLHKSFCPLTGAYELSYYLSPESRKDGLHRIFVSSSRRDLRLFFRPGYRIEADKPAQVESSELATKESSASVQKRQLLEAERKKHPELELAVTACYDTLGSTDFNLELKKTATIQDTDDKGIKGLIDVFEFLASGSYFASRSAPDREHPRQLDFSFCTFESGGQPLRHFEGTASVGSAPEDYRALAEGGFAHSIKIPEERCHPEKTRLVCIPPLTELDGRQGFIPKLAFSGRLVVRDRESGALGSAEILLVDLGNDQFPAPIPQGKTNESFGTKKPESPLAMCGDVYQLEPWTRKLPLFSELDATAPLYATSLGVYSRFFTAGIPGVTSRTEWFGVNYQSVFGIDKPGKYEFDLLSDDGAKVYIDDKLIVSDDTVHSPKGSRGKIQLEPGAHNIRVSYFQGPRVEVALVLLIKPPGRAWRLFDTRDFPNPDQPGYLRRKLSVQ